MIILIHDLMQYSNLPSALKSPGLDSEYPNTGPLTVTFSLPSGISEEDRTSGVLSQPLSYDGTFTSSLFDGILSMPIFPKLQEEFLINDLGEYLIDDLGNNLTGLFFPSEYIIDPATRIITDDLFFDGFLSQPMSVIGTNEFDCLGIGGTDASELTINGSVTITSDDGLSFKDGLYRLPQILQAGVITIDHNGTYLGRLACGTCRRMCISPSREPGFYTNIRPRETLSGQRIAAAGGYGGQIIGVDFRYKVDRDIYTDFQLAYNTQIMQGFPFFIDFENDDWLPMNKFYGYTDNNLLFQSSVNYFRYSRRFEFKQAF